ncbi:hypothetical protein COU61_04880, partial [Candidatus Pacearchaeota archaeon CG10_big_fil_rev_8_21_14_0_10_35_13]
MSSCNLKNLLYGLITTILGVLVIMKILNNHEEKGNNKGIINKKSHNNNLLSTIITGTFIIMMVMVSISTVSAALPSTINVHGKLTDADGVSLTGNYNFTFRIWSASTGGTNLHETANLTITTDNDGIYSAIIPAVGVNFSDQYYLGITVQNDAEMTPRINLTSSPYSFRANVTDNLENNKNYNMANLTVTSKITFSINGETIDNIINGLITITGGINATTTSYVAGSQICTANNGICATVGQSMNYTNLAMINQ